jgi:Zn-dependent protease
MRDPFSWSFPLGRLFGITIRIHLLFPLVALALILRAAFPKDGQGYPGMWLDAVAVIGILFVSVLLHEFGHCFGARMVEGDAHEILMWPLGGLAAIDVPHTPRANFIATICGPLVNVLLCLVAGMYLLSQGLVPPLNPLAPDAYAPHLYRWAEGTYHGTDRYPATKFVGYQDRSTGERVDWQVGEKDPNRYERIDPVPEREARPTESPIDKKKGFPYLWGTSNARLNSEPSLPNLNFGEVLAARVFFLNWFLFLLNLLPGFPLDGGRMLQALLWWRGDYRQATLAAVFSGFVVMVIICLFGMVANEVMPLFLAWFIYATCKQQWLVLETGGEEPMFGYDFSQGYTSLERDQPASPPRRKRPNFIQRWLQKRAQRKAQRAQETREAEERRMDELLEKVQQHGLQALTDEERRFLTRVSARYRNRN